MFAAEIERAIATAPRGRLAELAGAIWKGFAAGAIGEADAQALAEAIEARKMVPPPSRPQPRRVGSRPRSPESMERRRRWVASGWLPPQVSARFTLAENAVLAVVAAEVSRRGECRLTLDHIAALAGVCRSTVQKALREAKGQGVLTVDEWRITAWRNAPNTVRIVSPEWRSWLRLAVRRGLRGGEDGKSQTPRVQILHRGLNSSPSKDLAGEGSRPNERIAKGPQGHPRR